MPHKSSTAGAETAKPHYELWIRVPPLRGLGARLAALHEAANAIGPHTIMHCLHTRADWVGFGFKVRVDAADFRARAIEICAVLVEPGAPPVPSPHTFTNGVTASTMIIKSGGDTSIAKPLEVRRRQAEEVRAQGQRRAPNRRRGSARDL